METRTNLPQETTPGLPLYIADIDPAKIVQTNFFCQTLPKTFADGSIAILSENAIRICHPHKQESALSLTNTQLKQFPGNFFENFFKNMILLNNGNFASYIPAPINSQLFIWDVKTNQLSRPHLGAFSYLACLSNDNIIYTTSTGKIYLLYFYENAILKNELLYDLLAPTLITGLTIQNAKVFITHVNGILILEENQNPKQIHAPGIKIIKTPALDIPNKYLVLACKASYFILNTDCKDLPPTLAGYVSSQDDYANLCSTLANGEIFFVSKKFDESDRLIKIEISQGWNEAKNTFSFINEFSFKPLKHSKLFILPKGRLFCTDGDGHTFGLDLNTDRKYLLPLKNNILYKYKNADLSSWHNLYFKVLQNGDILLSGVKLGDGAYQSFIFDSMTGEIKADFNVNFHLLIGQKNGIDVISTAVVNGYKIKNIIELANDVHLINWGRSDSLESKYASICHFERKKSLLYTQQTPNLFFKTSLPNNHYLKMQPILETILNSISAENRFIKDHALDLNRFKQTLSLDTQIITYEAVPNLPLHYIILRYKSLYFLYNTRHKELPPALVSWESVNASNIEFFCQTLPDGKIIIMDSTYSNTGIVDGIRVQFEWNETENQFTQSSVLKFQAGKGPGRSFLLPNGTVFYIYDDRGETFIWHPSTNKDLPVKTNNLNFKNLPIQVLSTGDIQVSDYQMGNKLYDFICNPNTGEIKQAIDRSYGVAELMEITSPKLRM